MIGNELIGMVVVGIFAIGLLWLALLASDIRLATAIEQTVAGVTRWWSSRLQCIPRSGCQPCRDRAEIVFGGYYATPARFAATSPRPAGLADQRWRLLAWLVLPAPIRSYLHPRSSIERYRFRVQTEWWQNRNHGLATRGVRVAIGN